MNYNSPDTRRRRTSAPRLSSAPRSRVGARPDLRTFAGNVETRVSERPDESASVNGLGLAPQRKFRSVLVPLDGTPFAEHALPLALAIARRSGAAVRLLHVHTALTPEYEPIEFQLNGGFEYWLKQRHKAYLGEVVRRIATVSSATAMPILRESEHDIARAIAAEAKACADLVVMATHRRSRFGRWWNGSVAEALLRETSIPLLLAPGRNATPNLADAPPFQRVLIPVNGSPVAEAVFASALDLGDEAEYTLLPVASDAPDRFLPCVPGRVPKRGENEKTLDDAPSNVRDLSSRGDGRGRRAPRRTAREMRSIANEIIWQAQVQRSDLIALTTRERGGLERWIRGSVGLRVIRKATMPVLVVPERANAPPGGSEHLRVVDAPPDRRRSPQSGYLRPPGRTAVPASR